MNKEIYNETVENFPFHFYSKPLTLRLAEGLSPIVAGFAMGYFDGNRNPPSIDSTSAIFGLGLSTLIGLCDRSWSYCRKDLHKIVVIKGNRGNEAKQQMELIDSAVSDKAILGHAYRRMGVSGFKCAISYGLGFLMANAESSQRIAPQYLA